MDARILVTGSEGYVGRETVFALESEKAQCVRYDKTLGLNCMNPVRVWSSMRGADAVLHLAALKSVPESRQYPVRYFINNFMGSLVVSAIAKWQGVPVVFASSAAVYVGDSPYALSKQWEERAIRWMTNPHVILRYFNIGGKSEHTDDPDSTNLFSVIGSTSILRVRNARSTRDYTHVSDVAEANVAALKHVLHGGASFCTDIFSGSQASVLDVLSIYRFLGKRVQYEIGSEIEPSPQPSVDNRHILGWVPKQSLQEIVASELRYTYPTYDA